MQEDCLYSLGSNETSRTFYPYCEVNGSANDANGYRCERGVTLKKDGGLGYCGDRVAEDWEDCDCNNGSQSCTTDRADLNEDRLTWAQIQKYKNSSDYLCRNCKIGDQDGGIDPIACFNVNNGSISINKGEILPFYRNIEKIDNDKYVEIQGNYRNALKNHRDYQ